MLNGLTMGPRWAVPHDCVIVRTREGVFLTSGSRDRTNPLSVGDTVREVVRRANVWSSAFPGDSHAEDRVYSTFSGFRLWVSAGRLRGVWDQDRWSPPLASAVRRYVPEVLLGDSRDPG